MKKVSKFAFLLVGTIMPILGGGIHSLAHFNDLTSQETQQLLKGDLLIFGEPSPIWNSWGWMSLMMGTAFIIIGLLNFETYRKLRKEDWPPLNPLFVMILYVLALIYASVTFNALPQLYGGIFGLAVMVVAIGIIISQKNKTALS